MNIESEMAKGAAKNALCSGEFSHINIRVRGDLLILESSDEDGNVCPHARLRRKSINKWFLELPVRRGWESTFMEGSIQELIKLLKEKFPWTLSPV
jgi:hypothetical protein